MFDHIYCPRVFASAWAIHKLLYKSLASIYSNDVVARIHPAHIAECESKSRFVFVKHGQSLWQILSIIECDFCHVELAIVWCAVSISPAYQFVGRKSNIIEDAFSGIRLNYDVGNANHR